VVALPAIAVLDGQRRQPLRGEHRHSIGSAATLVGTSGRLRDAASFTVADRRAATAEAALNSSLRSAAATRSTP
jgi:hypothetical protein